MAKRIIYGKNKTGILFRTEFPKEKDRHRRSLSFRLSTKPSSGHLNRHRFHKPNFEISLQITANKTTGKARRFVLEVTPGFEPGNQGFADPCLTTWLCHHLRCIICELSEKVHPFLKKIQKFFAAHKRRSGSRKTVPRKNQPRIQRRKSRLKARKFPPECSFRRSRKRNGGGNF